MSGHKSAILVWAYFLALPLWSGGCGDNNGADGESARLEPKPGSPHAAMIGHWQKVDSHLTGDRATLTPTTLPEVKTTELYISAERAWRVDGGKEPVCVRYEVLEENQEEFWLRKCVITPTGNKIYSLTRFSSSRKEMRDLTRQDLEQGLPDDIARMVRQQIGGATLETVYRKVDDKTSPSE